MLSLVVCAEQHRHYGRGDLEHDRLGHGGVRIGGAARAAPVQAHTTPQTHASLEQRHKQELEQVHIVLGVPSYPLAHRTALRGVAAQYYSRRRNVFAAVFRISASGRGWRMRFSATCSPYTDSGVLSVYAGRRAKPQGN